MDTKMEKKHIKINKLLLSFLIVSIILIISIIIITLATPGSGMNDVLLRFGNLGINIMVGILISILMIWIATYEMSHLTIKIPDYIKRSYPCPINKIGCEKENLAFEFTEVEPISIKLK